VLFVCCLIVVPLPPGENPFAVNNNNKKKLIPLYEKCPSSAGDYVEK
jgi:hypothetical protein